MSIKPFFGHAPDWVYDDPAYEHLTNAEWIALHIIAGQCRVQSEEGDRGCFAGKKLYDRCRCSERTFRNVARSLEENGFITKLYQGGGKGRANEYGIPAWPGAMDDLRATDDPRYARGGRQTMHNVHGLENQETGETMKKMHGEPCSECRGNHALSAAKPCTECIPVSTPTYPSKRNTQKNTRQKRDRVTPTNGSTQTESSSGGPAGEAQGDSGAQTDEFKRLERMILNNEIGDEYLYDLFPGINPSTIRGDPMYRHMAIRVLLEEESIDELV